MKIDEIYSLWNEFVTDIRYKKYFDLDNVRDWKNKLEEVKEFIDANNSRPTLRTNKQLNQWLSDQLKKIKTKTEIMKIDEIYKLWTEFINDVRYKQYF
jgi:hypothetical protein